MLDLYDRAEIETRWVDPSDLNVSTVGHLGFFRSDVGRPLWDEALDWLVHRAWVPPVDRSAGLPSHVVDAPDAVEANSAAVVEQNVLGLPLGEYVFDDARDRLGVVSVFDHEGGGPTAQHAQTEFVVKSTGDRLVHVRIRHRVGREDG
jgi:hypothetical protein